MIKKENNLEIIRLLLAVQVMVVHVFHHIDNTYLHFLEMVPGVPAFFFLSGFLIYASYEKSSSLYSYMKNRFLRLFPALLFVTVFSSILIYFFRINNGLYDNDFIPLWTIAQFTLGQAYNPHQLRYFGVGVFNGSLWTITVEILFYISVPLIAFLSKKVKGTLYILGVLSFLIYAFGPDYLGFQFAMGKSLYDFLSITPIVWGWMFILGIITYKKWYLLEKYIKHFWLSLVPIAVFAFVGGEGVLFENQGNRLGVIYFMFYVAFIIYFAFSIKPMPLKFDLSYSLYIWHMPIVNFLLVMNLSSVYYVMAVTLVISVFSWFYIEKPSLKLKRSGLLRSIHNQGSV
ncbi:acyltransferase family protein [Vibrio vulnificus]|uniref:acyltransferase family protein n=1 Tax=Vibrio vulnificus TaxID=672 RepID=UPI002FBDAA69